MEAQLIINVSLGIVAFLGGWVMKLVWDRVTGIDDDLEDLQKHHENDLKEVRKEIIKAKLILVQKLFKL